MSSDILRQSQWDALWAAALARRAECRVCTAFALEEAAIRKAANEAEARKRAKKRLSFQERHHLLRPYLAATEVFPVGTPAPEKMREAAKPAVTSVTHWAESAPAHGCHEMRKRISSRSTRSIGTWGKSYPHNVYQSRRERKPTAGYKSCGW